LTLTFNLYFFLT